MTRAQTQPEQEAREAASPFSALLSAGNRFARYDIVRCVGVGGMGAVFEATHTLLRKRVALKALHDNLVRSESARARFLREAETVARIRHPNVVDISDVGIEQGIPFLVMEFLEGEDLAALLEREQRLSVERAVDLVLPALAGLCAVHRQGIVHRDIKPENIFLAQGAYGDVVPKLVDFGVSKHLESAAGRTIPMQHTVAGTPHYMSPEQSRGSAVLDGRTDQYAVGVLLYQCLTGVRPYESESLLELIHMIDAGTCEPLRAHNPDVPEALEAIVQRAMSRRIDDRFPTTEAFGEALCAFASERVRAACARDFSCQHPPTVSSVQRELSLSSSLSAKTLASEELVLPPVAVTVSERPSQRSVSGVRARDTASMAAPASVQGKAQRAFWLAALVTAALMAVVAVWLLRDGPQEASAPPPSTPPPTLVADDPPAQPVAPAPVAPAATPAATPPVATPPANPPAEPAEARRSKRKRSEPSPKSAPPVDIQLSR